MQADENTFDCVRNLKAQACSFSMCCLLPTSPLPSISHHLVVLLLSQFIDFEKKKSFYIDFFWFPQNLPSFDDRFFCPEINGNKNTKDPRKTHTELDKSSR